VQGEEQNSSFKHSWTLHYAYLTVLTLYYSPFKKKNFIL